MMVQPSFGGVNKNSTPGEGFGNQDCEQSWRIFQRHGVEDGDENSLANITPKSSLTPHLGVVWQSKEKERKRGLARGKNGR